MRIYCKNIEKIIWPFFEYKWEKLRLIGSAAYYYYPKTFIIATISTIVCNFDILWYRSGIHFSIYLIRWWIVGELIGHLSSADAWTCLIGFSFVRASPARITPAPIVVISPRRSWVSRIVIAGVDVPVTFQACVITIVTSTVARSTVDVSWIAPIVILSLRRSWPRRKQQWGLG